MFRRGDLFIALFILSLAAAIFFSGQTLSGASPRFAYIKIDNQIQTVDLHMSDHEIIIENHGYHLDIVVDEGKICVQSSDCPDQICVRTGWLSTPGAATACVPAHVSIEVAGEIETDVLLQ